jgi:hypothetical protein
LEKRKAHWVPLLISIVTYTVLPIIIFMSNALSVAVFLHHMTIIVHFTTLLFAIRIIPKERPLRLVSILIIGLMLFDIGTRIIIRVLGV